MLFICPGSANKNYFQLQVSTLRTRQLCGVYEIDRVYVKILNVNIL